MDQEINSTIHIEKSRTMPTSILSSRAVLLVLSSNFLGKTFVIEKTPIVIGRQDDCDVVIDDPVISKKHCLLTSDNEGKFYLEDLGSRNSTFLNDRILKKKKHIIYGDRIVIGQTIIRFYLEEIIK